MADNNSLNNGAASKMETDGKTGTGDVKNIRDRINNIDSQILDLLNSRIDCCLEVAKIKASTKDNIFKPYREKEVISNLVASNTGAMPDDHLRAIYREILSSSRKVQRLKKVVYLGPEGTFSFFAGVEYLGHSLDFIPCSNLRDVFHEVAVNKVELGIIPLENSLQGSVGQSLDMFLKYDVHIHAEIFYKISHSLLSSDTTLLDIDTVYAHPQALGQCAGWLRINLPKAKLIPMDSSATAARTIKGKKRCAAIGHLKLGKMLGLKILSRGIEDLPDNWTRFFIISPNPLKGEKREKTSILFSSPDKSGALVNILTLFADNGINMKKLESRPVRFEKWKYVFFTDLECDLEQPEYSQLIKDLKINCHTLKILGSYTTGPYLPVL